MAAREVPQDEESPGAAVGAAADRATRDKMQRRILRAVRADRKRLLRTERLDIQRRCGGPLRNAAGPGADPRQWAPKVLGWTFTSVRSSESVCWYVRPAWSTGPVRIGTDAELNEWLAPQADETFGEWYTRVRRALLTAGIRQGLVTVDEVGA